MQAPPNLLYAPSQDPYVFSVNDVGDNMEDYSGMIAALPKKLPGGGVEMQYFTLAPIQAPQIPISAPQQPPPNSMICNTCHQRIGLPPGVPVVACPLCNATNHVPSFPPKAIYQNQHPASADRFSQSPYALNLDNQRQGGRILTQQPAVSAKLDGKSGPSSAVASRGPCRFWKLGGGCNKGNNCPWDHTAVEPLNDLQQGHVSLSTGDTSKLKRVSNPLSKEAVNEPNLRLDASKLPWISLLDDPHTQSRLMYCQEAFEEAVTEKWWEQAFNLSQWNKTMFGGNPNQRWSAWYTAFGCNCHYEYGGAAFQPNAIPHWLLAIQEEVMKAVELDGAQPNSIVLNYYPNGLSRIGWHADDEDIFEAKVKACNMISLTLGTPRDFDWKPCKMGSTGGSVSLGDGDIFVQQGMFQRHYKHSSPSDIDVKEPRISLTWRWITKHRDNCQKSGNFQENPVKQKPSGKKKSKQSKQAKASSRKKKDPEQSQQKQNPTEVSGKQPDGIPRNLDRLDSAHSLAVDGLGSSASNYSPSPPEKEAPSPSTVLLQSPAKPTQNLHPVSIPISNQDFTHSPRESKAQEHKRMATALASKAAWAPGVLSKTWGPDTREADWPDLSAYRTGHASTSMASLLKAESSFTGTSLSAVPRSSTKSMPLHLPAKAVEAAEQVTALPVNPPALVDSEDEEA
eukprot:g45.t1